MFSTVFVDVKTGRGSIRIKQEDEPSQNIFGSNPPGGQGNVKHPFTGGKAYGGRTKVAVHRGVHKAVGNFGGEGRHPGEFVTRLSMDKTGTSVVHGGEKKRLLSGGSTKEPPKTSGSVRGSSKKNESFGRAAFGAGKK